MGRGQIVRGRIRREPSHDWLDDPESVPVREQHRRKDSKSNDEAEPQ
jgi:hypothetical protein